MVAAQYGTSALGYPHEIVPLGGPLLEALFAAG